MSGQHLRALREARGLALHEVSSLARIPERYLRALEDGDLETLPPGPFHRGYHRQYRAFLGLSEQEEDTGALEPAASAPSAIPATGAAPVHPADIEIGEPWGRPAPVPLHGSLPLPEEESAALDASDAFDELLEEDTTLTIPRHEEVPLVRLVVAGFLITFAVLLGLRLGATVVDQGLQELSLAEEAATASAAVSPRSPSVQAVRVRTVEPVRARLEVDGDVVFEGRLAPGRSLKAEGEEVRLWLSDLSVVTVHANGERVEPLHNLTASRTLRFVADGP